MKTKLCRQPLFRSATSPNRYHEFQKKWGIRNLVSLFFAVCVLSVCCGFMKEANIPTEDKAILQRFTLRPLHKVRINNKKDYI